MGLEHFGAQPERHNLRRSASSALLTFSTFLTSINS
jgi:hypothetical protein